jgi:hypothetical protein
LASVVDTDRDSVMTIIKEIFAKFVKYNNLSNFY